jgi:hypothetical protein
MSGGILVVQFEPLVNKLWEILRNPARMLQALKYSYQSQMGTSVLVEVPSPPYRTFRGWLFMIGMVRP